MAKAKAKAKRRRLQRGTRDYAKPKAQVSLARWDQGAMGAANRNGLVTEERGEIDPATGKTVNPNGVKGVRRVDMLEVYHKREWISKRGYTAGERLRDAWEGTQRGKGADYSMDRVDSTPKPDATIDIQVDRMTRLVKASRCIPQEYRPIIVTVAQDGNAIGSLPQYRGSNHKKGQVHLYDAFEALADAMGC